MHKNELKGNLYKNSIVTLLVQLVRMLLQFALQRVFILTLGMAYVGYNSVFRNILQMLNMADLGVGLAITGFLYRPLAEDDEERISALMHIYRRIYHAIGFAIVGIGGVIMALLPVIIPDADCSNGFLRILFSINLLGTISSYFLAYRRTLMIAAQKSYYTNAVDMTLDVFGTGLQIITLFVIPNYVLYLVINVGKNILANLIIALSSGKKYKRYFRQPSRELVQEYKRPLAKYVKDVFVSKIAAYVFNGTDNIIISVCKGSLLAGYLSNYTIASVGVKGIITQVLSAVQATYGKYVIAEKNKKKQLDMTDNYIYFDYLIANVCTVCGITLFQGAVRLFYGAEYLLPFSTAALISVNLGLAILLIIPSQIFVVFMLYRYDKYVVCVSAALNILISVGLVMVIGVNGVLIGTTVTSLIYLFSRLYIMSTKVFQTPYKHYLKKLLIYAAVTALTTGVAMLAVGGLEPQNWGQLFLCAVMVGCIAVVLPVVLTGKTQENFYFAQNIFPLGRKLFWSAVVLAAALAVLLWALLHL